MVLLEEVKLPRCYLLYLMWPYTASGKRASFCARDTRARQMQDSMSISYTFGKPYHTIKDSLQEERYRAVALVKGFTMAPTVIPSDRRHNDRDI